MDNTVPVDKTTHTNTPK